MENKVLLINDMPGFGKVALAVMLPILTKLKCHTSNLPTALVSNTLDYGKAEITETTDYMKKAIAMWKEMNITYKVITTGFVVSDEQAELVYDYCRESKKVGSTVIVDPIMGDNGAFYPGVEAKSADFMKRLCAIADVILPNVTEACFMTGIEYKEQYTESEFAELISRLGEICNKSIVITSANIDRKTYTVIKENGADSYEMLPYTEIPVRFVGTGDIFSAVVTGGIANGRSLRYSVENAMRTIENLIEVNKDAEDKFRGLPVEDCIDAVRE